jgi:CxxC motif-containing protein (DUF1111 family)
MTGKHVLAPALAAGMLALLVGGPDAQPFRAADPGLRGGTPGAGGPLPGLNGVRLELFNAGKADFEELEALDEGLGPRFNDLGCGSCHSQPATGGTSPAINPQATIPKQFPGNRLPYFVRADGPVREARFKYRPDGTRDGGVHNLFVISGLPETAACNIRQPDFDGQRLRNNIIFRIPTPTFGAGLIEQIPDGAILANQAAAASQKMALGIRGRPNRARIGGVLGGAAISGEPNRSGNDGTITRFGWKAQNKSLAVFAGEAYNVEMGITNELFQTERDETPGCQYAPTPNDVTAADANGNAIGLADGLSGVERFALFMRFLAPPTPAPETQAAARGRQLFGQVGCALCHTPTLQTGEAAVPQLSNKPVNLYSDLLLHRMGPALADDIIQGDAGPDEFRTAPLWGLGQRIFFLHDGRTKDLLEAIQLHRSGPDRRFGASEANAVVDNFNRLSERDKQDVLNFLRSL